MDKRRAASTCIVGFSLILTIFGLIHALDAHDHDGADACPVCAQIASAHGTLRQSDFAPKCASFLFCAMYAAVRAFKPARPWEVLQTLIALKIQLNA
jgi:hypothetical protein